MGASKWGQFPWDLVVRLGLLPDGLAHRVTSQLQTH